MCTFAIMGISIAVVFNHKGNVRHYGQLAERAAQIKKKSQAAAWQRLYHGQQTIQTGRLRQLPMKEQSVPSSPSPFADFTRHIALEKGYSLATIEAYSRDLEQFEAHLSALGLSLGAPENLTKQHIQGFLVHLHRLRTSKVPSPASCRPCVHASTTCNGQDGSRNPLAPESEIRNRTSASLRS
jgi:Site-specific recombinase XerD